MATITGQYEIETSTNRDGNEVTKLYAVTSHSKQVEVMTYQDKEIAKEYCAKTCHKVFGVEPEWTESNGILRTQTVSRTR